ncbi:MAG: hypothetical protein L7S70_01585 [Pseudomonadales bacterium]|nr:hypothetical protein [Pseudomonadales bacterium]
MDIDPGLLGAGMTGIAALYGFNRANAIEQDGDQIAGNLYNTGTMLADGSTFKGYGVTSALGNTRVGPDGSVGMGVGPNAQMQNYASNAFANSQGLMGQAMQDPVVRQQQIYNQMMLAQQPQLNQMQAQRQAREYAMGRGGVRGSQFGGTAEDAAMARARVQGSNQAMLAAQQQALAEQAQQAGMAGTYGQLGQSQYAGSFMPMQQQMALMQLAAGDADRAQTGQLTGQGYLGQLGLGGMQTSINAQKAASELRGNIYDSILDNAGGLLEGLFG